MSLQVFLSKAVFENNEGTISDGTINKRIPSANYTNSRFFEFRLSMSFLLASQGHLSF